MTSSDRRAVLGAVLAAGAVGATAALPTAASTGPALSDIDRRVLDLWRRFAKVRAISKKLNADFDKSSGADQSRLFDRCDDAVDAMTSIEDEIADHIEASILALAASILIDTKNVEDFVARIYQASLVAIRPRLVGAIAEEADRMMAEDEEGA
jgi:hypothetical protein